MLPTPHTPPPVFDALFDALLDVELNSTAHRIEAVRLLPPPAPDEAAVAPEADADGSAA